MIQIDESNLSRESTDALGGETAILRYTVTGAEDSVVTITGDTTNGSAIVRNVSDTSAIFEGAGLTGAGIPVNATIESVDSATQITLSTPATLTTAHVALSVLMSDDLAVKLLVAQTAPPRFNNRPLRQAHSTPKGGGVYEVEVDYEHKGGELRFRASGSGGKVNLKQSKSHAYYPSPSNPATGRITTTGNTTVLSPVITAIPSTAGMIVGQVAAVDSLATATGAMVQKDSTYVNALSQTTQFPVGAYVLGDGVPFGATVEKIVNANTIILSAPAFKAAADVTLTFSFENVPFGTTVLSIDSATQITLSQLAYYTITGTGLRTATVVPIDFKGCINVDEKQNVAGVDIPVPNSTFTVQRSLPGPLDSAYSFLLDTLNGHKNSDVVTFHTADGTTKTYQPGELQFFYAEYGVVGTQDWEITLYCGFQPNITLPPIGDIVDVYKEGWDYFWVSYRKAMSANVTVLVPQQVCIEEVLPSADLQPLFN